MYWDHPDITVMVDWVSKNKSVICLCVDWDVRLKVMQFKATTKMFLVLVVTEM